MSTIAQSARPHEVTQRLLRKARKRTTFVRAMRLMLPAYIVGLLVLAGWMVYQATQRAIIQAAPDASAARMINPRFAGRDVDGESYTVEAAAAIRDQEQDGLIHLESPVLSRGEGERTLTVVANTGTFREQQQVLYLQEDVVAETRSGARFETQAAEMNVETGRVWGNRAISGRTAMGVIRANRFEIIENGSRVVFTGNVKARINTQE